MPGYYGTGQVDFTYPYTGARALLNGENPYITRRADLHPPWHGPIRVDGQLYYQIYPPTLVLLYVPLAWYFEADVAAASKFMFRFSLGCLALLSVVVWQLVVAARGQNVSALFVFPVGTALTFHPGMQLGLERGQSDLLLSLLCWTAVLAVVRKRLTIAWILTVCATAAKGYPLLFAFTLIPSSLHPKRWLSAGLGVLVGSLVFVAPVAQYLSYGLKGTLWRTDMFWQVWYNHGFKLAANHFLDFEHVERARLWLGAFGATATALWVFRTWQRRQQPLTGSTTVTLCGAATTALLTVLGLSSLSIAYNFCLLTPGVLVLAASQERLSAMMDLHGLGRHLFGLVTTLLCGALFLYRWTDSFPLSAVGLVCLLIFLTVCAAAIRAPGSRSLLLRAQELW